MFKFFSLVNPFLCKNFFAVCALACALRALARAFTILFFAAVLYLQKNQIAFNQIFTNFLQVIVNHLSRGRARKTRGGGGACRGHLFRFFMRLSAKKFFRYKNL